MTRPGAEATRLLLAARQGDRESLSAWVKVSQAEVWRLCASLVDRSEADDLTQETFVRAYRSLPSFRGEASSRTWLLSIARRVCADAIRFRRRQRRLLARVVDSDEALSDSSVEVDDMLGRLSPEQREAFALTQLLGLTYAEAGQICGCPVGTIRSRVARARSVLIDMVGEGESAIS